MLRNALRRERVAAVVKFMDEREGYGWRRRMEVRDRCLDQDFPQMWLSGRRLVSERFLRRFEDYAARFGYQPPPREAVAQRQDVRETLQNLCNP